MTKNVDIDKYKYSGYGIGFDRHGSFSFPSTGSGRNVMTFRVDMRSSAKIDNRKKIFWFCVKVLHKDENIDWVQKKCNQLILQSIIKSFA